MTETLTTEGYEQTREKLAALQRRLGALENRTDLEADHIASVRRSYKTMMRKYLRQIKLYEAKHDKSSQTPQS